MPPQRALLGDASVHVDERARQPAWWAREAAPERRATASTAHRRRMVHAAMLIVPRVRGAHGRRVGRRPRHRRPPPLATSPSRRIPCARRHAVLGGSRARARRLTPRERSRHVARLRAYCRLQTRPCLPTAPLRDERPSGIEPTRLSSRRFATDDAPPPPRAADTCSVVSSSAQMSRHGGALQHNRDLTAAAYRHETFAPPSRPSRAMQRSCTACDRS